ncbi:MAG: hypothetical protein V4736_03870, partial [Bdellovibrionota bacterium]
MILEKSVSKVRSKSISPPIVIDRVKAARGIINVVRDDFLEGGTKQRAAIPFLQECMANGYREFIYASPFCGFAQIALAASAKAVGVQCTLFCEADPNTDMKAHEFTEIAQSYGARVILAPTLQDAEISAAIYTKGKVDRNQVPLGFNTPRYKYYLCQELTLQWKRLREIAGNPKNLWLPVGSGTLAQVFRQIISERTEIHCVDVHVLAKDDSRIQAVQQLVKTQYYCAPEKFIEVAGELPPLASNKFYDAKVWQFIQSHSEPG